MKGKINTVGSKPDQSGVGSSLSGHRQRGTLRGALSALDRRELATLLARIARLWIAFVRGQVTLMLVIGVVTWLGLAALGVPGALALGIIAGLLEIVPSVGPVIATAAAAMIALLEGSTYLHVSPPLLAGVVILFYVLVQQLENILIVPRVLGDAVDLPALVVLLGIMVGAAVGGVPGAVLAAPVIATGREVLRYCYRKKRGEDPFPSGEAAQRPGAHPGATA